MVLPAYRECPRRAKGKLRAEKLDSYQSLPKLRARPREHSAEREVEHVAERSPEHSVEVKRLVDLLGAADQRTAQAE